MSVVTEIVNAVFDNNPVLKHTSAGDSLSTTFTQASYIAREFPLVKPMEFVMGKEKQSTVYVPILKMLQALLSKDDILDKALPSEKPQENVFSSFRDGSRFKENTLLTEEEFRIVLSLYIDDFEVANPLGTSKKKA